MGLLKQNVFNVCHSKIYHQWSLKISKQKEEFLKGGLATESIIAVDLMLLHINLSCPESLKIFEDLRCNSAIEDVFQFSVEARTR